MFRPILITSGRQPRLTSLWLDELRNKLFRMDGKRSKGPKYATVATDYDEMVGFGEDLASTAASLRGSATKVNGLGYNVAAPARDGNKGYNGYAYQGKGRIQQMDFGGSDEELDMERGADGPKSYVYRVYAYARNPMILISALGSLLFIIVLLSISNMSPVTENLSEPKEIRPLLDNDQYLFARGRAQNLRWVTSEPDGTYVHTDDIGSVVLDHIEIDNTTTILQLEDLVDPEGIAVKMNDFFPSADLKYLLIETNYERGWRHSFFADYYLYNVQNRKLTPLTTTKAEKSIPLEHGHGKVSLALWSPVGHNLAWIRENDVHVTLNGETEVQITTDGSKNIINGMADWVYEGKRATHAGLFNSLIILQYIQSIEFVEEVFGTHEAMWFSPDGKRLAFLTFNDTLVEEFRLQYYMQSVRPYPNEVLLKYPKPGTPNPTVVLHIANPSATDPSGLDLPVVFPPDDEFAPEDRLIVDVKWSGPTELLVKTMNRVQDEERVFVVRMDVGEDGHESWISTLTRKRKSTDGAWIDRAEPRIIPPSAAVGRMAASYVELMEDANGYAHLAYFRSVNETKPTAWLTSGTWEVTEVVAVVPETAQIFFMSTEDGSVNRHLYSVQLDGSDKKRWTPTKDSSTLTFGVFPSLVANISSTNMKHGEPGYYSASFSPHCKYYVLSYLGPELPFTVIEKTVTEDKPFSKSLSSPLDLKDTAKERDFPKTALFTIKNDNGDDMNARIIVPADFDLSGQKKYPVLLNIYGGPGSQSVRNIFQIDFMTMLASQHGFISLIVDGRGTGFKGRKFRACVSEDLGKFESLDYVAAGKYMGTLPFVDKAKIGIWGWSYGGFQAAKVIETNSGVFSVGMSVAPVTSWRYYDTVYTERYMKTPAMNPGGYETSAITKTDGFKKAKFLLIHGLADDNVHFQNSASLVWLFTGDSVRNYRVQYFTDSDHSIYANGANGEVFSLLRRYIQESFGLDPGKEQDVSLSRSNKKGGIMERMYIGTSEVSPRRWDRVDEEGRIILRHLVLDRRV
ncbi:dipeptidyl peptidase IV N-terminal region-domain-containing protein [Cladochytrium replicatum]|nr:dipeptidyl peptidase IV N-terminal region-domain-containing protein [Cladochytrium replicatum]